MSSPHPARRRDDPPAEARPSRAERKRARTEERRADDAFLGEYSSPRLHLPGWGLASLLMAAPGAVVPWLLPAMLEHGVRWSTVRPLLLIVPVTALLGFAFGVVAVRRVDGGAAALVGLALNVVLLLLVATVVVILVF